MKSDQGNMLRKKGLYILFGATVLVWPLDVLEAAQAATSKSTSNSAPESTPEVAAVVAPKKIKLFSSMEIRSRGKRSFAKWADMWRRQNLPRTPAKDLDIDPEVRAKKCRVQGRAVCGRAEWDKFIAEQSGKPKDTVIRAVNRFMNRTTYILDPINWGIPDYWETPDEFFLRDGDCEDYAISKYITLKRLGVAADTMRIVVLQDENLRAAHAVLAVRVGDEYLILDNQVDAVLSDTKILHYRPVYSINETGWWLHKRRKYSAR